MIVAKSAFTREENLRVISRVLSTLSYQLSIDNQAGLNSLSSITEDILKPVLAILLKLPDLKNANAGSFNTEVIDLYSESSRQGIQVTSETRASKITETLDSIPSSQWNGKLNRIRFCILSPQSTQRHASMKVKWQSAAPPGITFDTDSDVLDGVPALLQKIRSLEDDQLDQIRTILARSYLGNEYYDLAAALTRQVQRHLDYEKGTLKYIPEIFVETPDIKDLARCFANPVLFFGRTLEGTDRMQLDDFSNDLRDVGLPALTLSGIDQYLSDGSWTHTQQQANRLKSDLQSLKRTVEGLKKYEEMVSLKDAAPERRYVLEERRYEIGRRAHSICWKLEEIIEELKCVMARVLIFTSPAGQGKTMFSCDLVDRLLPAHGVPGIFLTGNYISQHKGTPITDLVLQAALGKANHSVDEGFAMLNAHAEKSGRPLLVIIDGLNEHSDTGGFAQTLHRMMSDALPYPHIRFLLTCRTEFYEKRFGTLGKAPLNAVTHTCRSLDSALRDEPRKRMVTRHFEFFGLDPTKVSSEVAKALEQDRILLRLFCEAYGSRGDAKPHTYIASLYRLEIFRRYFDRRVAAAADYRNAVTGEPLPDVKRRLIQALRAIVGYMVSNNLFGEVPVEAVPQGLGDVVEYLLGEEIILRRDLTAGGGVFDSVSETISFTFDEFRDFLIAEYLADHLYEASSQEFVAFINGLVKEARPIAEGTRRFLFHIARRPGKEELLACCNGEGFFDNIFVPEIFNAEQSTVSSDDVLKVRAVLSEGKYNAREATSILVRRWNAEAYPILNLLLLLEVVEGIDADGKTLIESEFQDYERRYGIDAVVEPISKLILDLMSGKRQPRESAETLVRLLIAMLPIDEDYNLDSPAYFALEKVFKARPKLASLLLTGLESNQKRSWPFLWRLAYSHATGNGALHALAMRHCDSSDQRCAGEAKRFLDRTSRGKD